MASIGSSKERKGTREKGDLRDDSSRFLRIASLPCRRLPGCATRQVNLSRQELVDETLKQAIQSARDRSARRFPSENDAALTVGDRPLVCGSEQMKHSDSELQSR